MSKFKNELKYVSLDKTIELFGQVTTTKSKVISVCACGKESQTKIYHIRHAINKHGDYSCMACRARKLWKNSEYKEDHSRYLKNKWKDPKYKQTQSLRSKEQWKDPEYKNKVINATTKVCNSEEVRKRNSLIVKNRWNNEKYRKAQSIGLKEKWKNSEYIRKQEAYRKDPEYKVKVTNSLNHWLTSGKDSKLERVTQQILNQLSIKFERQKVIGPYCFDLFVPSHNLLIECQGEYWHSSEKAKRRDASKFTYINEYFPNLDLIYLYERDFLNPCIVKSKLVRKLFDHKFEEEQIDFELDNIEIKELSVKDKLPNSYYSAPEEFLQSFHYAGFGCGGKHIFGAYLSDKLITVCKFASLRKEVAVSLNLKINEVLELDRLCIHPNYRKENFVSWFISRCVKLISQNIKYVISFVDPTFDNLTINYEGWTQHSIVNPSHHYVNKEGWVLHKKTLCNHAKKMGMSESKYAEEFEYEKIYGKEKTKFILKLNIIS